MTHWILLTSFTLLVVIGTANVFSSTFVDDSGSGNAFSHLIRQAVIFLIGLVPSWFFFRKDYHFWRKYTRHAVVLTIVLLVLVLVAGVVVNGARRWLGIGSLTFQPSEFAKLTTILYVASIMAPLLERMKRVEFIQPLSRREDAPWWKRLPLPHQAFWMPLVMAALIFKQPDAGTAIIVLAIPSIILSMCGASVKKVKIPLAIIAVAFVGAILVAPYRFNRILAWIDPWGNAKTIGYQTVQSLIAIGSGGFMGQGIGEGLSKFSYLPEAHTDFAFAVLAQEWGLRGSLLMVLLFMAILYFGCVTAWTCRDKFGMMLALGITLYFSVQGFINIGMVSDVFPVVGVPLPFISYGGTSLIVNMVAASLLLNISRSNYKESEKQSLIGTPPLMQSMEQETRSKFRIK